MLMVPEKIQHIPTNQVFVFVLFNLELSWNTTFSTMACWHKKVNSWWVKCQDETSIYFIINEYFKEMVLNFALPMFDQTIVCWSIMTPSMSECIDDLNSPPKIGRWTMFHPEKSHEFGHLILVVFLPFVLLH